MNNKMKFYVDKKQIGEAKEINKNDGGIIKKECEVDFENENITFLLTFVELKGIIYLGLGEIKIETKCPLCEKEECLISSAVINKNEALEISTCLECGKSYSRKLPIDHRLLPEYIQLIINTPWKVNTLH